MSFEREKKYAWPNCKPAFVSETNDILIQRQIFHLNGRCRYINRARGIYMCKRVLPLEIAISYELFVKEIFSLDVKYNDYENVLVLWEFLQIYSLFYSPFENGFPYIYSLSGLCKYSLFINIFYVNVFILSQMKFIIRDHLSSNLLLKINRNRIYCTLGNYKQHYNWNILSRTGKYRCIHIHIELHFISTTVGNIVIKITFIPRFTYYHVYILTPLLIARNFLLRFHALNDVILIIHTSRCTPR